MREREKEREEKRRRKNIVVEMPHNLTHFQKAERLRISKKTLKTFDNSGHCIYFEDHNR